MQEKYTIIGKHFRLRRNCINMMGYEGFRMKSGDFFIGLCGKTKPHNLNMKKEIIDILHQDAQAGNSERIFAVVVHPIVAISLFLERAVLGKYFLGVIEKREEIRLLDVPFNGIARMIIIRDDESTRKNQVYTIDLDGKIIE